MNSRERALFELANQLQFQVEKHGSRFTLRRVAGVSTPVEIENASFQEAVEFLNTWKLRGFHGG
jgi:hypothetical protein